MIRTPVRGLRCWAWWPYTAQMLPCRVLAVEHHGRADQVLVQFEDEQGGMGVVLCGQLFTEEEALARLLLRAAGVDDG